MCALNLLKFNTADVLIICVVRTAKINTDYRSYSTKISKVCYVLFHGTNGLLLTNASRKIVGQINISCEVLSLSYTLISSAIWMRPLITFRLLPTNIYWLSLSFSQTYSSILKNVYYSNVEVIFVPLFNININILKFKRLGSLSYDQRSQVYWQLCDIFFPESTFYDHFQIKRHCYLNINHSLRIILASAISESFHCSYSLI